MTQCSYQHTSCYEYVVIESEVKRGEGGAQHTHFGRHDDIIKSDLRTRRKICKNNKEILKDMKQSSSEYSPAACHTPAGLFMGRRPQYLVNRRLGCARASLDAMARR